MSATNDRFVFVNFGFFIYLLERDDRCSRIVIPKLELVPHANVLLLPAKNTVINGFLPATPRGDYLFIRMNGLSLSINSGAGARLGRRKGTSIDEPDFDWVPNIGTAFCGIKLNPDWAQWAVKDSVLTLGDGWLRALPDGHTMDRRWTWQTCHGGCHTQRVTTLTTFEPDSSDIHIVFTDTTTGAIVAEANFNADPMWPAIHLVIPAVNFDDKNANPQDVEFAHVLAIMRLCVRTTQELRLPVRTSQDTQTPGIDPQPTLIDTLGRLGSPLDLLTRLKVLHQGTIECSGQSVPPPDPEP